VIFVRFFAQQRDSRLFLGEILSDTHFREALVLSFWTLFMTSSMIFGIFLVWHMKVGFSDSKIHGTQKIFNFIK